MKRCPVFLCQSQKEERKKGDRNRVVTRRTKWFFFFFFFFFLFSTFCLVLFSFPALGLGSAGKIKMATERNTAAATNDGMNEANGNGDSLEQPQQPSQVARRFFSFRSTSESPPTIPNRKRRATSSREQDRVAHSGNM